MIRQWRRIASKWRARTKKPSCCDPSTDGKEQRGEERRRLVRPSHGRPAFDKHLSQADSLPGKTIQGTSPPSWISGFIGHLMRTRRPRSNGRVADESCAPFPDRIVMAIVSGKTDFRNLVSDPLWS